jgi:hypothetical protein
MIGGWQASLQVFLKTLSEILTAGIAITAFSLLLYALAFNLRDRVARSFAFILIFTVVVFTAEAIGSIVNELGALNFWLRLQWVGIAFLPAAYLHFSDALLAITGRPSRGRRRWAVRFVYFGSVIFLLGLPFNWLIGPAVVSDSPTSHMQVTLFTNLFVIFFMVVMVVSWANFIRAYRRTTTTASRRRMYYLIAGALAPALGAFPFLPYSPNFAANHQLTFWTVSVLSNIVVGILLVVMAYAVAFFGVSWPDRVVKVRLFKWIMRGPFTASVTLAATTLTRRAGVAFGSSYTAMVPIVMAGTILLSEYLITLFSPLGERLLFYGKDKSELDLLHSLENQLLTRNDLQQFLEMLLSTASDRLQAEGAYVAALSPDGIELVVTAGRTRFKEESVKNEATDELLMQVTETRVESDLFRWGDDYLFPLLNGTPEQPELIGLLGVSGAARAVLDEEQLQAMEILTNRAALALQNRRIQQKVFLSLESLSSQVDLIQRMRAAGQYDQTSLLTDEEPLELENDLSNWVKDALSHYWGGPKFTQNPLMRLRIVEDAIKEHDGNRANALRAILQQAIEHVRPEGERRFTAEWILYNILEMKFVEGRKVREVAMRLAMSEADLYRKQRVAIEAVAKAIGEMEVKAKKDVLEVYNDR